MISGARLWSPELQSRTACVSLCCCCCSFQSAAPTEGPAELRLSLYLQFPLICHFNWISSWFEKAAAQNRFFIYRKSNQNDGIIMAAWFKGLPLASNLQRYLFSLRKTHYHTIHNIIHIVYSVVDNTYKIFSQFEQVVSTSFILDQSVHTASSASATRGRHDQVCEVTPRVKG